MSPTPSRIAILADTHGLLRPQALAAIAEVELILHAGDVGSPEVLTALAAIAPLQAVRGNVDRGSWADALPETRRISIAGMEIWMLHDLQRLALDPVAAGIDLVVSGHSHRPRLTWSDGVCYLNPGAIGPRRFGLPITVALIDRSEGLRPRLIDCSSDEPRPRPW